MDAIYRYEHLLQPPREPVLPGRLAAWAGERYGDRPALRAFDGHTYRTMRFGELAGDVERLAGWLLAGGLGPRDRVALVGPNGPAWVTVYLAALEAGGIIVPIDPQASAQGIRHVLSISGSQFLFASRAHLEGLSELADPPRLQRSVCLEDDASLGDASLGELAREEPAHPRRRPPPLCTPDDPAALLFTSGTTGHSKGVLLSHGNLAANVSAGARVLPLTDKDVFLSVLPLHHAYEATVGCLVPLTFGCSITYAPSFKSRDLIHAMRATGVTFMLGVPLLFEKFRAAMMRRLQSRPWTDRTAFRLAWNAAALAERLGLPAGRVLFARLRAHAGLNRVRGFVCGGGPLDPEVSVFFNRLGILFLQGYGLTETSPLTHVNLPGRVRHDTVGPPICNVQCRIDAPDEHGVGEICIRAPSVFQGYYEDEESTAAVIDDEGWFHTGDLGRVDRDDYLRISGRSKSIIVTAGGKNIYPEEIEALLGRSPYIADALVIGVRRGGGYGEEVGALIHPDRERVDLHFEAHGGHATPVKVRDLIAREIQRLLADVPTYKRPHQFEIREEDFERTSTRKIKRYLYRDLTMP